MVHVAEKLLDEFSKVSGQVERPQTFMDIAKYPHRESVCSNILAFFMDPAESHGLGTLVLDALADAVDIADTDEGLGGNISIDREVITRAGNRIDILVASDTHAILIENKIYATVSNPLDDYTRYLELNYGNLKGHKILLTVFPTSEGREWCFKNLTYESFIDQIRTLLGRYVSGADTRHLMILLDFLNTLESLRKGSRMDQEFVKFLAERDGDIKSLFNNLKSLRKEMREKVQELRDLIDTNQYPNVEEKDLWRASTVDMFDNLYFKIRVAEDLLVGIDAQLSPHGWELQIFSREKGDPSDLRVLLERLQIQVEEKERFIHSTRFAYDESLDRISPVLQNLVDKLATHRGAQWIR